MTKAEALVRALEGEREFISGLRQNCIAARIEAESRAARIVAAIIELDDLKDECKDNTDNLAG